MPCAAARPPTSSSSGPSCPAPRPASSCAGTWCSSSWPTTCNRPTDATRMYHHLEYAVVAEHVVRVRLARPDVANALNAGLLAELDDAVGRSAADDQVHAWRLPGAPRTDGRPGFSAGAAPKEAPTNRR